MLKQITLAASMVLAGAQMALADMQLVMVEQPGCAYCAAWNDEIAPAYPKTAEGRFAPLVRADLHIGPPKGVEYARRVNFTPTFILIDNGAEVARIEGYPGEDFFWPIFAKLLQDHSGFEPVGN
ncbi:thioredoxin family protein [Tropicibacter sp. R15_0]|uniref:thioredoxin family protein n=1 Tax=Tropicibacter sp. R15_0 TaxID=2821101 RepID=UPI001ADAEF89|nr:thioredoxin family protein [Tropicibacter sp. R15_0]MBO9467724.1 thioredoxin family protein [Tropicibacter sp. R15_0]